MKRKRHIFLCTLYLVTLSLCLPGCRPKGILHSWEMRELLIDLHKTEAALQQAGYKFSDPERIGYYAVVLEKHGTTQAEFDSSLVWYTAHPQLFDKIYPKVIARLSAEEEDFVNYYRAEFSLNIPTEQEPQKRTFTHAQLDSVLWVTQHSYPHTWQKMPARPLGPVER